MNPTQTTPVDAVVSTPMQQTPAPVKLGKFAASYKLVQESWRVLKQDKEVMWFPVLSVLTSIVALIALAALYFFAAMGGDIRALEYSTNGEVQRWGYVGIFIYYLVIFFITNYFLAGIYIIVHGRFNGQDLSFTDGIAGANTNMDKIFAWSLISATVGLVLHFISSRSEIAGRIISMIFGAVWGILTYFSLPSLVIGQKSIKESFKDSASLIRKTWGETFIVNSGMQLFFILVFFIGAALAIGLIILVPTGFMFILVGVFFMLFIIGMMVLSATLQAIFKLALYEYASTGKVPEGFSAGLIEGTVRRG
jgi:hypothetical protein